MVAFLKPADVVRAAMKAAKESDSPLNAFQIVSLS